MSSAQNILEGFAAKSKSAALETVVLCGEVFSDLLAENEPLHAMLLFVNSGEGRIYQSITIYKD